MQSNIQNKDATASFQEFQQWLERRLESPLVVRLNENTHSYVSVARSRSSSKPTRASIHRMFLEAPPPVWEALADFIAGPTPKARSLIRQFMVENREKLPPREIVRRKPKIDPVGVAYDLAPIADRVHQKFFKGRLTYSITWGRRPRKPPRRLRHIQLGVWNDRLKLIRIHPLLDTRKVPLYFLDYVIFHEMTHIIAPPEVGRNGRIRHHTATFYQLEKQFPHYEKARRWEKEHLPAVVRAYCKKPSRRAVRR